MAVPVEKIPVTIEKEVFLMTDYKKRRHHWFSNQYRRTSNRCENALSVETVNDQPYPKTKLKEHIWGLIKLECLL